MNARKTIGVIVMILAVSTTIFGASKKSSELFQIADFQAANPEERLAWVNAKLDSKEYSNSDISMDLMTRLIMDVLVLEKTPQHQMKKYGEIRGKYGKLGATYDLEKHLAVQYLATDPEAMKADIPGKCKIINRFSQQKVLSWPGIADLLQGMMALHLATSAEYQAMAPMQKIEYLKSLDGLSIVTNQTSCSFSKGVAAELMSGTAAGDQGTLFKEIDFSSDFFTKTAIRTGYID